MQGPDLTNVSTEIFKAKPRAKLAELALQSGASIVSKSIGLCKENQSANQVRASGVSTTKLCFMFDYIKFID